MVTIPERPFAFNEKCSVNINENTPRIASLAPRANIKTANEKKIVCLDLSI